jgi:hypothetical protein
VNTRAISRLLEQYPALWAVVLVLALYIVGRRVNLFLEAESEQRRKILTKLLLSLLGFAAFLGGMAILTSMS